MTLGEEPDGAEADGRRGFEPNLEREEDPTDIPAILDRVRLRSAPPVAAEMAAAD